jgi:hypothetical protein
MIFKLMLNADLKKLKLMKDPISVLRDVEVQASGNSIENFEGTVLSIKHIKKSTPCLMILP